MSDFSTKLLASIFELEDQIVRLKYDLQGLMGDLQTEVIKGSHSIHDLVKLNTGVPSDEWRFLPKMGGIINRLTEGQARLNFLVGTLASLNKVYNAFRDGDGASQASKVQF